VSVPGVLETANEPIKNPVTGAPHRIQVVMPDGFEHRLGEICSSRIASTGGIKFDVPQGHGTLATVTQTPQGVAAKGLVAEEARASARLASAYSAV
jgi:hypothetical protein